MTYRVTFTSKARLQFTQSALWWAEHRSSDQAARWLDGFDDAIKALAENPDKHGTSRENDLYDFAYPVHQLLFGISSKPTHRALFQIRGDTVYVVAVRHLSQRDVTPEDME